MQALTCTLAPRCWWTPTTGTSGQPLGKLDIKMGKTGHPLGCWTTSLCNLSSMSRFGLYDHSGNANWGGLASWLATISTHLTILWKQNEQKRCPHCACNGLLRTLWHDLHKCLFSRLFARIFFGKPGLLPSREDGGDGSCEAIIPPSNVGDPRRVFRERPQWNNTTVVGSSDALFFVKSLKYAPTGVKMMSVHTQLRAASSDDSGKRIQQPGASGGCCVQAQEVMFDARWRCLKTSQNSFYRISKQH